MDFTWVSTWFNLFGKLRQRQWTLLVTRYNWLYVKFSTRQSSAERGGKTSAWYLWQTTNYSLTITSRKSFAWRRLPFEAEKSEGAVTDKMEETFLSQPSKECGGETYLGNYETPLTISKWRWCRQIAMFEFSAVTGESSVFNCGKSCLSQQI